MTANNLGMFNGCFESGKGSSHMASDKKAVARARWRILKRAIHSEAVNPDGNPSSVSVRSFTSFDLFRVCDEDYEGSRWTVYSFPRNCACPSSQESSTVSARVKLLPQTVTLDSLTGFNNTGNVCVWPSEEVMAYYCLREKSKFEGKSVLELGGGMTGLAGLMLSLTGLPIRVCLTDGNTASVENLKAMLAANCEQMKEVQVSANKLVWDEAVLDLECPKFDYVLCADCLFFTDLHSCLAKLIHRLLGHGGKALLFNPHRSGTLLKFIELVRDMEVNVIDKYDQEVWDIHQELCRRDGGHYKPDIHYPIMVTLASKQLGSGFSPS